MAGSPGGRFKKAVGIWSQSVRDILYTVILYIWIWYTSHGRWGMESISSGYHVNGAGLSRSQLVSDTVSNTRSRSHFEE